MNKPPCAHCGGCGFLASDEPYEMMAQVECPTCKPAPPIQVSPLASEPDSMALVRDARERRAALDRLSEIVAGGDPDVDQIEKFQSVLARMSHDVPALCDLAERQTGEIQTLTWQRDQWIDTAHLMTEKAHDAANKAAIKIQEQANEITRLRDQMNELDTAARFAAVNSNVDRLRDFFGMP